MSQVFFGKLPTAKYFLDDTKEQYIEVKKFNVLDRKEYLNSLGSMIEANTDGTMRPNTSALGETDYKICQIGVVSFKVKTFDAEGKEIVKEGGKEEWPEVLATMDGELLDVLTGEIAKLNPWLRQTDTDKKK